MPITGNSFMLLEPLLAESLQDYLARHGLKANGSPEAIAAVAAWRKGPAWVSGVTDWRTREQRRQDAFRALDFDDYYDKKSP